MAQIKYFISTNNPDILALIETRVNSNKALNIICKINFSNLSEYRLKVILEGFGYSGEIIPILILKSLKLIPDSSTAKLRITLDPFHG